MGMTRLSKTMVMPDIALPFQACPDSRKVTPVRNVGKDLNVHFTKMVRKVVNNHRKRCSTALVTRKRQIKTRVYHLTPIRRATI